MGFGVWEQVGFGSYDMRIKLVLKVTWIDFLHGLKIASPILNRGIKYFGKTLIRKITYGRLYLQWRYPLSYLLCFVPLSILIRDNDPFFNKYYLSEIYCQGQFRHVMSHSLNILTHYATNFIITVIFLAHLIFLRVKVFWISREQWIFFYISCPFKGRTEGSLCFWTNKFVYQVLLGAVAQNCEESV